MKSIKLKDLEKLIIEKYSDDEKFKEFLKENKDLKVEVIVENIKLKGLSEVELSMVKLENVREVLFQALLLDDVKFDDGKMYAELCSIFLKK